MVQLKSFSKTDTQKTIHLPRFHVPFWLSHIQARSLELVMGGFCGGLGAEHLATGGQWGSEDEIPILRRLGVWGQSPQPPGAKGLGAEPSALGDFYEFSTKITRF